MRHARSPKIEVFDILATAGDPKTIVIFSYGVRRKHECFEKTVILRNSKQVPKIRNRCLEDKNAFQEVLEGSLKISELNLSITA